MTIAAAASFALAVAACTQDVEVGTSGGFGGSPGTTTGTTAVTTAGPTTTGVTSGPTTTSVTAGPGGGGSGGCLGQCEAQNATAFHKFDGYELRECGCQVNAPCAGPCGAQCMLQMSGQDPMLGQGTACDMCLSQETQKGTNSSCTVKAALNDCLPDSMCAPFVNCALACP